MPIRTGNRQNSALTRKSILTAAPRWTSKFIFPALMTIRLVPPTFCLSAMQRAFPASCLKEHLDKGNQLFRNTFVRFTGFDD